MRKLILLFVILTLDVFFVYGNSDQKSSVNDSAAINTIDTLIQNKIDINEVVILASRIEENIISSPVSIEKLSLKDIRNSSAADFFDEVSKLKGVHLSSGSLLFPSFNTRGFATIANTRFLTLMDGIDLSAPLLNFPTGNIMGLPELDAVSIELVPGASSALYGPNAFNGTLLMNSKSPYLFPGLSVSVKGGFTTSKEGGTHPLGSFAFRIAQKYEHDWALKINFSVLNGTDWVANDYTTDKLTGQDGINQPGFDGLNTYGDERPITLPVNRFKTNLLNALTPQFASYYGGDQLAARAALSIQLDSIKPITVNRSGIKEELLIDNTRATSIKGGVALYKRWKNGIELSYDYRIGFGNTIYFGSDRYAFRGFTQQFNKVQLKNDFLKIMGYVSPSGFGSSYNIAAVGALANEAFKPSGTWGSQYLLQYVKSLLDDTYTSHSGNIGQITSLDISNANQQAREFANMGIPQPGTDSFQAVVDMVRHGYFQKGGAQFKDRSWKYHAEANLNISKWTHRWLDIQIGGNFRFFNLSTDGTIYNEDPEGTGMLKRIKIWEFGTYIQLDKRLWSDRIRLSTSVRYDKNKNFKGQASPRVSVVLAAGKNKDHFIRASYQTGFRIPETQAQYIYFPSSSILLGGIKDNAGRYGLYEGGAIRKEDWDAFIATRDSSLLKPYYLDYVKPEKLTAFEIGYKTKIGSKLLLDVNAYFNIYRDFQTQILVYNIDSTYQKGKMLPGINQSLKNPSIAPTLWNPYTNLTGKIRSWGASLGWSYNFWKSFALSGNYSYIGYKAPDNFSYRDVAFNTPQHSFFIGIESSQAFEHFGFDINYRWQNKFKWSSPFGTGDIEAQGSLNAQINYSIPKANSVFKISATNIAAKSYRTNYGGPYIGTTFLITWVFDMGLL